MQDEIITYYELRYISNVERVKAFLSMNFDEVKIKTSEVLAAASTLRLEFNTIHSTKEHFLKELKKATGCN